MKKVAGIMACMLTTLLVMAQAQQRTGSIVDENGNPVPNASVTEKNGAANATSNPGGVFTISVPKGATLVLSSVSFETTEFVVGDASSFTITMRTKSGVLSDVVVVGYGTRRRTNVTSAVATIDNKKLENRPVTNAIGALQGVAAGLTIGRVNGQPGAEGYNIQIRGYSSAYGGAALVLIDGAPGNLGGLNPNDIENISVLKDAAAASIYGARAAGGVILVTTKKGKSGKPVFSYNGRYASQKPANVPGKLHSWEEAEMLNESRINAGQTAGYTDEQIGWMKDPNVEYIVNPANPNDYLYFYDLDQRPIVLRDQSPQWDHNFSVRGGGQKDSYFGSIGYFKQQGVFKLGPDKTDRINARFNYQNQLSNVLSLDARISYRQSNVLAPSVGTANIFSNLYTTRALYPTFFPGTTDRYINDNSGNFAYARLKDGGAADQRTDEFSGQFSLRAKDVVKGLTLTASYNPRLLTQTHTFENRTIPRYNLIGVGSYINTINSYQKNTLQQMANNLQLLVDYDLSIGDHDFHVLGGYAYEDQRDDTSFTTASNLYSNDLFTTGIGDPSLNVLREGITAWGMESYFGRFNYAYKGRYLLEASLRYDGSSRLSPVDRWELFPSVSLGWRISEENWFSNFLPGVNEFKLRGSWGRLGNSDGMNSNYEYMSLLEAGPFYPFNNTRARSVYQRLLASAQKSWETIETANIGLDLTLLRNRLNLTADYYTKTNNEMLVPIQVSSIIGIATPTYNLAKLKTWGWEISLGWRDNVNKQFSYWINANIGDNWNKVLEYNGLTSIVPGSNFIVEGKPLNTLYGYQAAGYYQTADELTTNPRFNSNVGVGDLKYIDQNKDNLINVGRGNLADPGDLVDLGNTSPRYMYGFDFGFNFKGFDFMALFQGVGQRKLFLQPAALYPYTSSWIMPMDYHRDHWTPENTDARFPRLFIGGAQNTQYSSHWLMNGAYLRLKNVQLGYNLPAAWISKAKLSAARVYFSGQDLWEINNMWLKNAFDPEMPSNATWQYPFFRTYSVGVNLTF